MTRLKLNTAPNRSRLQSLAATTVPVRTEADQGKFGAGLLSDVSVITRGEALGHGYWIDAVFLGQVAAAMSAAVNGVKSRFTHPGLSADGLSKGLGLMFGGMLNGDQVLGDLHFYESAHKSPDGDLADYVITRAKEDPLHFGTSIVFQHNFEDEKSFMLANGGVVVIHDDGYETYETIEGFKSPDPLNVNNLPHCRLNELSAVDVVDDPAANPNGLFHRDLSTISAAQEYLDYAIGLSDKKPTGIAFDIDPERARLFFQRYAAERGVQLPMKGSQMAGKLLKKGKLSAPAGTPPDPNEPTASQAAAEPGAVTCPDCGAVFVPDPAKPADSQEPMPPGEYAAQHQKYVEAFGAENGSKWFFGKLSFEAAQVEHYRAQLAAKDVEITSLKAELEAAKTKLAAIANSGENPLDSSPPPSGTEGDKEKKDFSSLFKRK